MSCGRDVVAKVKQRIEQKLPPGTLIESNVIAGSPHHVILETAETWHADMIIMGSHGRAGFDRFVMGSISLAVLSHAKCSVSIVRLPDESKRKTKHTEKKSEQAVTA
jgi:nucleotide-binding universal stress UspA family protein